MLLLACSGGSDLQPGMVEARESLEAWRRVESHLESGDLESALSSIQAALALRPQSPELWLSQGHVYAEMERFDEAIDAASQALSRRPGWPDAHFDRACWESRAGRFRRAASDLQIALDAGGSFRLSAAADSDLDPLREHPDFGGLLPEKALPAEVSSDPRSYFLGSDWTLVFRFLNRPDHDTLLQWTGSGQFPGRHVRTVEDIWPDDDVNAHELRVTYKVIGAGEGRVGPWRIEASGLERDLQELPYLFRQPPGLVEIETLELTSADFVVPSTQFAHQALNSPQREGDRVWVKTLPGAHVEWTSDKVVHHEYREQGQTQWLGWEAVLPPDSDVQIRRGNQMIWSGSI